MKESGTQETVMERGGSTGGRLPHQLKHWGGIAPLTLGYNTQECLGRKLRQFLGRPPYSLSKLRAIRSKCKSLLQVQALKQRVEKQNERRREINKQFGGGGGGGGEGALDLHPSPTAINSTNSQRSKSKP